MVTADGEIEATVHVLDGSIERIGAFTDVPSEAEVVELGELVLMPGFVDSHVHINEPGRTEWEGFETATRAAAAGGVTTVVDMPLNSVPATTSVTALEAKLLAAEGKLTVDVAFWGGVVPGNRGELKSLHKAGVTGFKCFLVPSGVPEFECIGYAEMEEVMQVLAPLGTPLLVHAEDPEALARAPAPTNRFSCSEYSSTRPVDAELTAVRRVLAAAERTGTRAHIVHVSAHETVTEIAAARARGVRVSAETCPHYLWFADEEVPPGGVQWKCAPPIRGAQNRAEMRRALREGRLDLVASDHSPAPAARKQAAGGDFLAAWGGISSLQIAPLVTWSVAQAEGCTLRELSQWLSAAPAALAGLAQRKGSIAAGLDADLVAFDPDAETVVNSGMLYHRHSTTPYEGFALRGRIAGTWLRGESVYRDERFRAPRRGRPLLRGQA